MAGPGGRRWHGLNALYGDVDELDAFVFIIAEEHVKGPMFGELQAAIWEAVDALRDGDRFVHENTRLASLRLVRSTSSPRSPDIA